MSKMGILIPFSQLIMEVEWDKRYKRNWEHGKLLENINCYHQ